MPTPKRPNTRPTHAKSTPDPDATKAAQKEALSPPNVPKADPKDEHAEAKLHEGSSDPKGKPAEPHVKAEDPVESEPHNTDARVEQAEATEEVMAGTGPNPGQILYPYVPVTYTQALEAERAAQAALAIAATGNLVTLNPDYAPGD